MRGRIGSALLFTLLVAANVPWALNGNLLSWAAIGFITGMGIYTQHVIGQRLRQERRLAELRAQVEKNLATLATLKRGVER